MVVLFIAVFNSILGLSVLFPIQAPLGRELGLTEVQVGLLSTTYALMQLVMGPVWGRRSQRIGRKPVLLTGVLGFSASFFLFGFVGQLGLDGRLSTPVVFAWLLVARLVGGTFSSATLPTAQAYVADSTGRSDRTSGMALIGAAFGLGIIFGPAIGAALAGISLLAPVYFSASAALVNAIFIWGRLEEAPRRVEREEASGLAPVAIKVWPLLLVGITVSLAAVSMEQTVAFYFQDRLHLGPTQTARAVGMALVFYGVVAVFAQGFIVRRYRWPPLRLLQGGLPLALAGFVGLVFAKEAVGLTLALALQGFGHGLILPGVTAAVSLGVAEKEQGAVAGLNSSAQALGRLFGPVVGTSLYQVRPEYPYAFSALLLLVVLTFLVSSRRLQAAVHPAGAGLAGRREA